MATSKLGKHNQVKGCISPRPKPSVLFHPSGCGLLFDEVKSSVLLPHTDNKTKAQIKHRSLSFILVNWNLTGCQLHPPIPRPFSLGTSQPGAQIAPKAPSTTVIPSASCAGIAKNYYLLITSEITTRWTQSHTLTNDSAP